MDFSDFVKYAADICLRQTSCAECKAAISVLREFDACPIGTLATAEPEAVDTLVDCVKKQSGGLYHPNRHCKIPKQ